jgi:hypothetical protein
VTSDSDQPSSPRPDSDRPQTIELTASEAEPAAGRQGDGDAAQAAEPSEAAAETPGTDASSGTPSVPPPDDAAVPPRRRGWLPAGVSLLGAATAGAGIALAVAGVVSLFVNRDDGVRALEARIAGLEGKVRDLAAAPPPAADTRALDDVTSRVAKLEAAGAGPSSLGVDPALADRLAGLEGEVKALADTIGALGHRTDEAAAAAREARARADATATALAALTQKVAGAAPVERSEVDAKFEALANRVAGLERSEKTVASELAKRSAAESGARAVRLALAATALNSAVERGAPFAAELATAKALVSDPKALAPLEPFAAAGVPTAAALVHALVELAPALRQSAPAPSQGFLQRLQANAGSLVRIRPQEEVAGNDSAAIITRIEVKAAHADLPGALAELAQLPPAERAPAEPWIKQAQARGAAVEASRRLAADALAGLSK